LPHVILLTSEEKKYINRNCTTIHLEYISTTCWETYGRCYLSAPYTQRFARRPRDRQVTRKATVEWGTHPWQPHTRRGLPADPDRIAFRIPCLPRKLQAVARGWRAESRGETRRPR
jgi:hypothetical protein